MNGSSPPEGDVFASIGTQGVFYRVFLTSQNFATSSSRADVEKRNHTHVISNSIIFKSKRQACLRFSSSLLMTRKTTKDQTKTRRDEEKECVAFFCALYRWLSSVASSSGRLHSENVYVRRRFAQSFQSFLVQIFFPSSLLITFNNNDNNSTTRGGRKEKCKLKPLT